MTSAKAGVAEVRVMACTASKWAVRQRYRANDVNALTASHGPPKLTVAGRSRHGVNCTAATPFGDPLLQSATS
jgi:hypothetical protein